MMYSDQQMYKYKAWEHKKLDLEYKELKKIRLTQNLLNRYLVKKSAK
jgi:hypothetical protein